MTHLLHEHSLLVKLDRFVHRADVPCLLRRLNGTRVQNWLLFLVQVLGITGGFGLFMNAVYPENQLQLHHFWAGVVFNGFGCAMLLSPATFWRRGAPNLPLSSFTVSSFAPVMLVFVFARVHWVEWLPVTLFLLGPGLLGLHTRRALVPQIAHL